LDSDCSSEFPIAELAPDDRRYPAFVFTSASEAIRKPLIAGFFNLGNTCYFNSNLHVLLSIPEFVDYCLTEDCKATHQIGFEFHRLVTELAFGRHITLINGRLRLAIDADEPSLLDPKPTDSVYFFQYLFRTIRRYLPLAPLHLSEFTILTAVHCQSCRQTFQIGREEAVYVLPIEPIIVTREEIRDSLPAMISRWAHFRQACPKCNQPGGEFTRKLARAPQYLFVNNQLDYGEGEERFKRKMVLDLDTEALHIGFVEGETDVVYRLKSFMHHNGRWAKYGHDVAFVRYDDGWLKYSDEVVDEIPDIGSKVVFGEQYLYLWERLN
jgi:ubiquitin C-terminal hydrolase